MHWQIWLGLIMVVVGVLIGVVGGGLGGQWFDIGYWVNLVLTIGGFGLIFLRILRVWVMKEK